MTGTTISTAYVTGLAFSDAATYSPVTIVASGMVTNAVGPAIQAGGAVAWTIGNSGLVQATGAGTSSVGLFLSAGGSVITNNPGGLVSGGYAGVYDTAPGTLTNYGSIAATSTAAGAAVVLGGGLVANAGGTITGASNGVGLSTSGVVNNTGVISGSGASGIRLNGGGAVGNYGPGGSIGGFYSGVSVVGAGIVVNHGTIQSTDNSGSGYSYGTATGFIPLIGGVILSSGSVTNGTGATIASPRFGVALRGAGSIDNAGTIDGKGITVLSGHTAASTVGFGVWLMSGGTLTNEAGGQVYGGLDAVLATGTIAPTIVNHGLMSTAVRSVVDLFGDGGVTNAADGAVTSPDIGLLGRGGGTFVNAGSIAAPFGVLAVNAAAIASNSGTIVSAVHNQGAGIQLKAGGTITNLPGGYISSWWVGAQIGGFNNGTISYAPGGTVVNYGVVKALDPTYGNGAAVWVKGNGVIINKPGGTIAGGPYGIVTYNPVTVENHGLVTGSQFAFNASTAGNHDRIISFPGASMVGLVAAEPSSGTVATGTLELAAGVGVGTISGFGSHYTGFSNVIVDGGANWSLGGTLSARTITSGTTIVIPAPTVAFGAGASLTLANPGAMAGTITGFAVGDTLTLGGITDVTSALLGPNNLLTVSESGGGAIALQLDPLQSFSGTNFGFTTGVGGTALVAPCFAAGTRLRTASGSVAVEHLLPGTMLASSFGGLVPTVWIGHRHVDCRRHPRPWDVWPVRVRAGAFAAEMPATDLWLSPDHAVHVDDVLIPVRYLVNGRTIVQEQRDSVTYYHVELPAHDVLLAEGLACESYLDTGNRGAFANGGGVMDLHPDFARDIWTSKACAPLVMEGPVLAKVRGGLLARATELGHRRIGAPALRVMAGGRVLPTRVSGRHWEVRLPAGCDAVRIVSRTWVPAHTDAGSDDTRCLGVALSAIALDDRAVPPDGFGAGWLESEPALRWTGGEAELTVGGAGVLTFTLAHAGHYWADAAAA